MTRPITSTASKTTTPRPKYRTRWWCSRLLQGRHHRVMQRIDPRDLVTVIVHVECAGEMQNTDEWSLCVVTGPTGPRQDNGDHAVPSVDDLVR